MSNAKPLTYGQRCDRYCEQDFVTHNQREKNVRLMFTPKQLKRRQKKLNQEYKRKNLAMGNAPF